MNNMFTDGVKRVMQLAREESARLGHNYIGTEHLLLGMPWGSANHFPEGWWCRCRAGGATCGA